MRSMPCQKIAIWNSQTITNDTQATPERPRKVEPSPAPNSAVINRATAVEAK